MGLPGGEIDDGLAILYLLGRDDVDVAGITNTFGNSSLRDVARCTARLLEQIGRSDISRYSGETYTGQNPDLILDIRAADRYGNDHEAPAFPSEAATFLVDAVNKAPGEISILGLGPLGNLHDAWRLDRTFYEKTKEIVVMGGVTGNLTLGGKPCRELNFSCNPEAAYSVVHAECPVAVFTGHICLQAPFTAGEMRRVEMWPDERLHLVRLWLSRFTEQFGVNCFYLWDLLPAVYLSHPELFDLREAHIAPTVESLRQGMLRPVPGEGSATIVMPEQVTDGDRLMDILEAGWRREWELESTSWGQVPV